MVPCYLHHLSAPPLQNSKIVSYTGDALARYWTSEWALPDFIGLRLSRCSCVFPRCPPRAFAPAHAVAVPRRSVVHTVAANEQGGGAFFLGEELHVVVRVVRWWTVGMVGMCCRACASTWQWRENIWRNSCRTVLEVYLSLRGSLCRKVWLRPDWGSLTTENWCGFEASSCSPTAMLLHISSDMYWYLYTGSFGLSIFLLAWSISSPL